MPTQDEMQEELRMARRALHGLRLQSAQFGISLPVHLSIQLEDTERQVARLERALGLSVTEPRELPQVEPRRPVYVAPPVRDFAAEEAARREGARQADITHQQNLLSIHRRNMAHLRTTAKAYGEVAFAPMHVQNQLVDVRNSIVDAKRALDQLGGSYDNLPGDE